jgi:hypothetical protein
VSAATNGEAYARAVAEMVAASERERQIIDDANASTGPARALSEARKALVSVRSEQLLRPVQASQERGTVAELQQVLRDQEHAALARAADVTRTVAQMTTDAEDVQRRSEIHKDMIWRLPLPLFGGIASMTLASSGLPLFVAVLIGAVAATVGVALTRPFLLLELKPAHRRSGLEEPDIGLVAGGVAAALLGLLGAGLAAGASAGQRALTVVVAAGGAYAAGRRLAAVRRSRTSEPD